MMFPPRAVEGQVTHGTSEPLAFRPEKVTACVFDAFGTLFDTSAVTEVARAKLGAGTDRLAALWRHKQLEYSWLRGLMGKYEDFWHVTGEALDHAMGVLKINDPLLRASLMQAYLTIPAFPDAAAVVEHFHASGRRTAILSNGSVSMLTAAVNHAHLDPLFYAVLSVDAVSMFKPHPTVYQLAMDRLELTNPEQVCFVSGNGWDAAGAAAFGFQAVWLNRSGAVPESMPFRPRAVLSELGALPSLFAG